MSRWFAATTFRVYALYPKSECFIEEESNRDSVHSKSLSYIIDFGFLRLALRFIGERRDAHLFQQVTARLMTQE